MKPNQGRTKSRRERNMQRYKERRGKVKDKEKCEEEYRYPFLSHEKGGAVRV